MTLTQLKYAITVSEAGSMNQAAKVGEAFDPG
jgi:DNA-binding transcriptional LysR family regulator